MANKIPTAKSFLLKDVDMTDSGVVLSSVWTDDAVKAMKEFAKLHVKAALEAAGKVASSWENSGELEPEILSTYPESLIV